MSKWPMRGHFRYLRFNTFSMTPRTPQCEVFWASLSNSKHSGVPKDSKSPTLGVLGFTPTLGQSGVVTLNLCTLHSHTPIPYLLSIPSSFIYIHTYFSFPQKDSLPPLCSLTLPTFFFLCNFCNSSIVAKLPLLCAQARQQ